VKNGILLDGDVIIWFLRGRQDVVQSMNSVEIVNRLHTTPISVAEIYTGAKPKEETKIDLLFKLIPIINVDKEIAKLSGEFLKKYYKSHSLELGDAIIAATAVHNNLQLWTYNKKHYPMIKKSEFYI